MLHTKPIRSPRTAYDGLRISVMSRHTLNDGITPDTTITSHLYDVWRPVLAPPPTLIGDYYKRNLPWNEFAARYQEHLQTTANNITHALAYHALQNDVTFLCTEASPERCHRRLLAEHCQLILPQLSVDIQ